MCLYIQCRNAIEGGEGQRNEELSCCMDEKRVTIVMAGTDLSRYLLAAFISVHGLDIHASCSTYQTAVFRLAHFGCGAGWMAR